MLVFLLISIHHEDDLVVQFNLVTKFHTQFLPTSFHRISISSTEFK